MAVMLLMPGIGAASGAEVLLRLNPSVCALSDEQPRCRDTVQVRWQSDTPQILCLFLEQQNQPLKCWHSSPEGQFHYQVSTDQNRVFQLRRRQDNELVASAVFEVLREHTEYRSRRRRPWNFF